MKKLAFSIFMSLLIVGATRAAWMCRDGLQLPIDGAAFSNSAYAAKGWVLCPPPPTMTASNFIVDQLTNSAYMASWDVVSVMATYNLTNADILSNTADLQAQAKQVTNLTIQAGMIMDGARAGIEYLALGGILTTNRFITNSISYPMP